MHIKITNGVAESYAVDQLLLDNPQVSFPQPIPSHVLAEYGVFPLLATEPPKHDEATQNIAPGAPAFDGQTWHQTWAVTEATAREIAERADAKSAAIDLMRRAAYAKEADPLFFKWQRGEAQQSDWLAKVAEIKSRFPE